MSYNMRFKRNSALIILLVSSIVINISITNSTPQLEYFPNGEWRTSTPEDQGVINPNKLDEMYPIIMKYGIGIDSIIIIKNGYLVYDEYFEYYNYSNLHRPMSTTKSIISILIGIANATGIITNLDQPILDIFTNRTFTNVDARKQALTIRHLLKMQMGVDWTDVPFNGSVDPSNYELLSNMTADQWENLPVDVNNDYMRMVNSDDRVQYVLDKPLNHEPGTVFKYNCGAAHLLSAIIQVKTGKNTVDFAKKHLFDPLNITDYYWWNDSMGISTGDGGLWLQPIDMAKFGYLCLNNGTWNGNQVVPKEWIQESTFPHTTSTALGQSYGYLWWINPSENYYYALGLGGQFIVIKPDEKMVVTITASEYTHAPFWPRKILHDFILESLNPETATDEPTTSPTSLTTSTSIITTPSSSTTSSSTPAVTPAFSFIPLLIGLLLLMGLRKKK
ncbi:MAG: serine hydrolase domain-containing protein [Candidatus Hodarchaeales archaeon]